MWPHTLRVRLRLGPLDQAGFQETRCAFFEKKAQFSAPRIIATLDAEIVLSEAIGDCERDSVDLCVP